MCVKFIFPSYIFNWSLALNVRSTTSTGSNYFDNSSLLVWFRFNERKMERAFWRFPRRFLRIKGITWSERLTRTERRKLLLGWWSDRWAISGGKRNSCRWRRNWSLPRSRRNLKTEEYRKAFPRNSSASWLENRLRKWVEILVTLSRNVIWIQYDMSYSYKQWIIIFVLEILNIYKYILNIYKYILNIYKIICKI